MPPRTRRTTRVRPAVARAAGARTVPSLLLAGTAALLLAGAPPATAAAGPDWTAAPRTGSATRPGTDGARTAFFLQGPPGAVLEDRLVLANPSDRSRTLTLRATGTAPRTAKAAGSAAWIRFARSTVTLPPRTRAVVPFTVTVPAAAVPADRPAALVAAEGGRERTVRLHLRITGPALSALTVEDLAVTGRGGATRIRYTLVNRGNTVLRPEVSLRAEGLFGSLPGREVRAPEVVLQPGGRAESTEPWPDAPALDSVELTLTATATGGARATAAVTARFLPGAGPSAAGLALVGGAAVLLVRARRARRAAEPPEPGGPGERTDRSAPEAELTGALR
ncbi:hypothetical protein [Streptomyces sp. NPDC097619]|uniref:COG1470 family protein n=1 Tax=Streptomyces sp. NPDC097619 TaxID=3157228 RepID=UPI003328C6B9